jgi:hypothetical protein
VGRVCFAKPKYNTARTTGNVHIGGVIPLSLSNILVAEFVVVDTAVYIWACLAEVYAKLDSLIVAHDGAVSGKDVASALGIFADCECQQIRDPEAAIGYGKLSARSYTRWAFKIPTVPIFKRLTGKYAGVGGPDRSTA